MQQITQMQVLEFKMCSIAHMRQDPQMLRNFQRTFEGHSFPEIRQVDVNS